MNYNKMLLGIGLACNVLGGCDHNNKTYNDHKHECAQDICDTWSDPVDTISTIAYSETITLSLDRILQSPLTTMKGVSPTLKTLVGNHYEDSILYMYNKELFDSIAHPNNYKSLSYKQIYTLGGSLDVPRVYPPLVDFFVPRLEDFIQQHPELHIDTIDHQGEIIIITRDQTNKVALGYYTGGMIYLANYCSPGTTSHKTPKGLFFTNLNKDRIRVYGGKEVYDRGDRQDSIKRSYKYDNAPMPYGIPLAKGSRQTGIWIHVGVVNGYGLSHGCLRQSGYVAQELYDVIDNRIVHVFIDDLYTKKQ